MAGGFVRPTTYVCKLSPFMIQCGGINLEHNWTETTANKPRPIISSYTVSTVIKSDWCCAAAAAAYGRHSAAKYEF